MPKTRFKPMVDGIAFPYALSFTDEEFNSIQDCFRQAITPANEHLQSDFGLLIKCYDTGSNFHHWIDETCEGTIPYTGGLVFTILDYYYTKTVLPKGILNPAYLSQDSTFAKSFRKNLWSRASNYLSSTAPRILLWTAVRNLLPANIFPDKTLTKQIRSAVKNLDICDDIQVHYSYDIPKAGGYRWAYQNTLEQWKSIKTKLDHGNPCPILLINHTTQINSHHCVLAYDYTEISPTQIKIEVFNTLEPTITHHISIDFSQEKVGILSTFNNMSNEALTGILLINYSPKQPALPFIKKILRYTLYPQLSWHIHHLFNSQDEKS